MKKTVNVEDSVGMVLAHDITQIIPGVSKGPVFRKGHVVREEDIPKLLSCGKEHLYILEIHEGILHENEAAIRLAKTAIGENGHFFISEPKEGKVNITANADGLLKIDIQKLTQLNSLGELMMATIHGNIPVKKGELIAGTRIIPLLIEEQKMSKAEQICGDGEPLLSIAPFKVCSAGVIVTGSEVKKERIKDSFGPVVEKKLAAFQVTIAEKCCVGDDFNAIGEAIKDYADKYDVVIVTGGMSVDPDDASPRAIRETGAEIACYGVPVLPGSMFMLAYLGGKPVMGLPGCVMYDGITVFDMVLPRILAGERMQAEDFAVMGHGGLCLKCETCTYPRCGFGKSTR